MGKSLVLSQGHSGFIKQCERSFLLNQQCISYSLPKILLSLVDSELMVELQIRCFFLMSIIMYFCLFCSQLETDNINVQYLRIFFKRLNPKQHCVRMSIFF